MLFPFLFIFIHFQ